MSKPWMQVSLQCNMYPVIYYVQITVSSAVRNLALQTPDNTTLVFTWQSPGTTNGDLLHYIVRIAFHKNNSVIVDGTVMETETSFTADNLSKIQNVSVTILSNSLLYIRAWSSL